MRGFPKILATKEDYEYVRTHFPKQQWQPHFQQLLDTRYEWFFDKQLTEDEVGIEDDTHKIEVDPQSETRYQFSLKLNENCKLKQLGYTVKQVQQILKS